MIIDVRIKFLLISVISLLSVSFTNTESMLFLTLTMFIIITLLKINIFTLIYKFKKMILLIIPLILLNSMFTYSENVILEVLSVTLISKESLRYAIELSCRLLCLIGISSILLNEDSRIIMQGLIQLKLPFELCMMSMMGLKFIPILTEKFEDSLLTMKLRGVSIKEHKLKDKITLISYIIFPVIANSIYIAKDTAISLQLRGFNSYDTRSSFYKLKFKLIDYISMFLILIYILIFFIINGR